jgi:16S rRNA processing protein RimM
LGTVGRPHATRGEVTFRAYNEESRTLTSLPLPYTIVLEDAEGKRKELKVTTARFVRDHFLLGLEGVTDRDTAESFKGRTLWIDRNFLPPPAPGEFYWQDLVGCEVRDQHGKVLGEMKSVFNTRAHGVASVVTEQGEETLIPLVPAFLLNIDVPGRKLVVERLAEEDMNDSHLLETE